MKLIVLAVSVDKSGFLFCRSELDWIDQRLSIPSNANPFVDKFDCATIGLTNESPLRKLHLNSGYWQQIFRRSPSSMGLN